MKLTWTVSTYNRPHLLKRTIHCFEKQTHEDRYMVIFDDGGQYGNQEGDRWRLVSTDKRCKSLGAKRNHVLTLVPDDTHAVLPVDDDDIPLPWHTEASAKALENADWSRPSVVLAPRITGAGWLFSANYTGHPLDQKQERLYHPAWAMRLDVVRSLGGYPDNMSGPEDRALMLKMDQAKISHADPMEFGYKPSFIYCWGNFNISGMLGAGDENGERAWELIGDTLEPATIEPWEPPFDLHNPVVAPMIMRRPF
jgi:glycosyltransferase involved in cell wall biosynthesis